jgi:mono/diheme cytochrome c family protein
LPNNSNPVFSGDAAQGLALWNERCVACHSNFDGALFSAATAAGLALYRFTSNIDLANDYTDVPAESLATYIADAMPYGSGQASKCDLTCGRDITAYFIELMGSLYVGTSSADNSTKSGSELYFELGCSTCHGSDGLGGIQPINFSRYSFETFVTKINDTMPIAAGNPDAWRLCTGTCAEKVGEYLWQLQPALACTSGERILPKRLRLLTRFEYHNTINDLFNRSDASSLAGAISADITVGGFDNNLSANAITGARMDGYWSAAQAIAQTVDLSPWLNANCDAASCFVTGLGERLFRRPLIAEELAQYTAIFNQGETTTEGARNTLQSLLISPNFLYRSELGELTESGSLSQFETATLLSYTFLGSLPDATLMQRASNNELATSAQIRTEVQRLIADPKAQRQFTHFGRQWLGMSSVAKLERDTETHPAFTTEIAQAMDQELELFLIEMFLGTGYQWQDFLNWDQAFVNAPLANYYGLAGVTDNLFELVPAGDQRGGLLRLGAVTTNLAKSDKSDPIDRGLFVRRKLLCQDFGSPPPNVGELEAPVSGGVADTLREVLALHSTNPACATCHQFIDDLGLAFEHYDAGGRFRTQYSDGGIIDASGLLNGINTMTDTDAHAFDGLQDLIDVLSGPGFNRSSYCVVENFQRLLVGEAAPDPCAVNSLHERWNPGNGSFTDLWIEAVSSQTFTRRQ